MADRRARRIDSLKLQEPLTAGEDQEKLILNTQEISSPVGLISSIPQSAFDVPRQVPADYAVTESIGSESMGRRARRQRQRSDMSSELRSPLQTSELGSNHIELQPIPSPAVLEKTNTMVDPASSNIQAERERDNTGLKEREGTSTSRRRRQKSKISVDLKPETSSKELVSEPQAKMKETLSITLHRSDQLSADNGNLIAPYVKITPLNQRTGGPILQGVPLKSVQLSSKGYNLINSRTGCPVWNEKLTFPALITSTDLLQADTILFFEILDKDDRNIAWAFLRMVGSNKKDHVGFARLQLYQYVDHSSFLYSWIPQTQSQTQQPNSLELSEAYKCWRSKSRRKFEGSLYVTTEKVQVIDNSENRSGKENILGGKGISVKGDGKDGKLGDKAEEERIPWRRLNEEAMELPNTVLYRMEASKQGASVVSYSSSGFYLAVGCVPSTTQTSFAIKIFDCLSGERIVALEGHQAIIYEITWSSDETLLMSASSDGTVRVWNVYHELINRPKIQRILAHPSFVYTARFFPRSNSIIVTGGYDHWIRTWSLESTDGKINESEPLRRFEGHEGSINAIRFLPDGSRMFSADSKGIIRCWITAFINSRERPELDLQCIGYVSMDTSISSPISVMQLHPKERKILLQNRHGSIRVLDTRSMRIIQEVSEEGRANSSVSTQPCKSCLSPCGNYIFAAALNNSLFVYSLDGKLLVKYTQLYGVVPIKDTILSSISVHPYDHTLAFGTIGNEIPVIVITKDEKLPAILPKEAGVITNKLIDETVTKGRKDSLKGSLK